METTLSDLVQKVHDGKIKADEWNWAVDANAVPDPAGSGKYVRRTCIFVMGDGSQQCLAFVVLQAGTTIPDAKTLVHEMFGVERVIIGVG